ncbi:hypothetical protein BDW72DRAFT_168685 [Aspergillus terricola var. indicus]
MIRSEVFQGQTEGVAMTELLPESQDFGGSGMRNSNSLILSQTEPIIFIYSLLPLRDHPSDVISTISLYQSQLPVPALALSSWLFEVINVIACRFRESLNISDPRRPNIIYTSKCSGTMKPFSDISTHTTASSSYSTSSTTNINNSTNNAQSSSSSTKVLKVIKKK